MSKITYEEKIQIYKEKKQGKGATELSKKYGITRQAVHYLESLDCQHFLGQIKCGQVYIALV